MALKDSYYTMRNLLPCILIDGINVGVSSSFMLHILPKIDDEKQDNLNAGYSLMGFGFGCVIGGFIGGKICDYIRAKSSIIVGMAIYTVCCVTFFIAPMPRCKQWLCGCNQCLCGCKQCLYDCCTCCSRLHDGHDVLRVARQRGRGGRRQSDPAVHAQGDHQARLHAGLRRRYVYTSSRYAGLSSTILTSTSLRYAGSISAVRRTLRLANIPLAFVS